MNVLLALAWPTHLHHHDAHRWFQRRRSAGFATCPLTQLGFTRISSNPRFTKDATTPFGALILMGKITEVKDHVFWPDSVGCSQAFARRPLLVGHQQLTDFYLVALAEANGGMFATLDRGVPPGPTVEIVCSEPTPLPY